MIATFYCIRRDSTRFEFFAGFKDQVAAKPLIQFGHFQDCKVYSAHNEDQRKEMNSDLERMRIRGYPDAVPVSITALITCDDYYREVKK